MKKKLIILSIATTGIVTVLNTKNAAVQYQIPETTVTVNHGQYLKNMKNEIGKSFKSGDRHAMLEITSWAENYVKSFNDLKAKHNPEDENIQNINSIARTVTQAKERLNKNENFDLTRKLGLLKSQMEKELFEVRQAVEEFDLNSEYQTNAKLNFFIRKYNRIYREFTQLSVRREFINSLESISQSRTLKEVQHLLEYEIKDNLEKYINLFLDKIETKIASLKKLIKNHDDEVKIEDTQQLTNLNIEFLAIKEEMNFLTTQGLVKSIQTRINKISGILLNYMNFIEKENEILVKKWDEHFAEKGLLLIEHMKKIKTEGIFEKIQKMLLDFKEERKNFLKFKDGVKDLNVKFEEILKSIDNIKKLFTEVRFQGIDKIVDKGINTEWWSSETSWKSWVSGIGYSGFAIPISSITVEGSWRLKAKITAVVRARNIIAQGVAERAQEAADGLSIVLEAENAAAEEAEMAFIRSQARNAGKLAAKVTTKTIFAGAWIGIGIGLGLFAVPSYILNTIQTNGAGLSYSFSRAGYITGFLAPMIQIKQNAKPQEMKTLNVLEILED